ncbi:MAG: hypothetical protein LBC42_03105 [Puniceicoccales bacterium]|jgi:hypothetical protein|nr:hypothetical protein [Puniceicoccales bacterium]
MNVEQACRFIGIKEPAGDDAKYYDHALTNGIKFFYLGLTGSGPAFFISEAPDNMSGRKVDEIAISHIIANNFHGQSNVKFMLFGKTGMRVVDLPAPPSTVMEYLFHTIATTALGAALAIFREPSVQVIANLLPCGFLSANALYALILFAFFVAAYAMYYYDPIRIAQAF